MMHILVIIAIIAAVVWAFGNESAAKSAGRLLGWLFTGFFALGIVSFVVVSVGLFFLIVLNQPDQTKQAILTEEDCRVDPNDPVLWKRAPIVGCPGASLPKVPDYWASTEKTVSTEKTIPSCGTAPGRKAVQAGDPRICY